MILPYKEITIFYTDTGSGDAILLLHGFLEDHTMWDALSLELTRSHRVITLDLLGHGQTGSLGDVHTMNDMADAANYVLEHLQVKDVALVGHSMGGYAALAFAKTYPNKLCGLCLMNSTFEADNDALKIKRAKANKMVVGNFESMVRVSVANLFSERSKEIFKVAFESALKIALKTSVQGYIAAQEGMRLRKNLTSFFVNAPFKKMILLGRKDAVLDSKVLETFAIENEIPVAVFSEGHMSYIENKTEYISHVVHFIENI